MLFFFFGGGVCPGVGFLCPVWAEGLGGPGGAFPPGVGPLEHWDCLLGTGPLIYLIPWKPAVGLAGAQGSSPPLGRVSGERLPLGL